MHETRHYAYVYAVIDPTDNMCVEVMSTTREVDTEEYPDYIRLDTYNEEYLFKYYDRTNGKWYEDEACAIEWTPS